MPGQVTTVLHQLRRIVGAGRGGNASDAELLGRFVTRRDEAALAMLVQRHGPLVWNVCRRILPNFHDAEDAFQATFLVFVRKAEAVDRPELLGNWLYGVAHRTALKARVMHARQPAADLDGADVPARAAPEDHAWQELQPVLDGEMTRLPEKYRLPLVLCYLEGKTHEAAAAQLGWPLGTVAGRLARARELLRLRLTRRGVTISASVLGLLLVKHATASAAPSSLVTSIIQAAASVAAGHAAATAVSAKVAALAEGVLHAMWISKFKTVFIAGLLAATLGLGLAGLSAPAAADKPSKPVQPTTDNKQPIKQKKELGPTVHGTLVSVDTAKNTVVVNVQVGQTKQTEEKSFDVSKEVKVLLEDVLTKGQPAPEGKLSDLPQGTQVTLTQSADKKAVVEIHARGPGMNGSIKSVNAAKGSFTIMSKDKTGAVERTFVLAPGAKVTLSDGLTKNATVQEGKLADLAEGTRVNIQLTVDQKSVLGVHVQGASHHGILKGHDAANNTITITVKEDGGLVDKTFQVAKDAQLFDLTEGSLVNLRMSVFDKNTVIAAQGNKGK
jgi:RNA polymerase sigma factor (sigma-70 family)